MDEIFKKMNISQNTIAQMKELNPNLDNVSKFKILQKIDILQKENCDKIQIRNIISSNSLYLDRLNTDINNLIKKLKKYGFDNLDLLFDSNPYILNLDDFEIENYIKQQTENGENIEDIIDELSSNPLLFNNI